MRIPQLVHRTLATAEQFVLLVAPHGGQRTSRCNAWRAMAADRVAAAARAEAAAVLAATAPAVSALAPTRPRPVAAGARR